MICSIIPPCVWLSRIHRLSRFVTVSSGNRPRRGEEKTLLRFSSEYPLQNLKNGRFGTTV